MVAVGGAGKTRVAMATGEAELPHRSGGVWFADLTTVTNDSEVVTAVGNAGGALTANDQIGGITVGSGTNGAGYTFAEIFAFDPTKAVASNPGLPRSVSATSAPLRSGRVRSSRTTSGRKPSATSMASRPAKASFTS